MKKIAILLIISSLSFGLLAHEFWLEPQKFILKVGDKISFRFFVGENFKGETVDFSKFKVNKFVHFSATKIDKKEGELKETDLENSLKFDSDGNHLLAFNNSNKFLALSADKFNEYLKEDGMDNVLKYRQEHGEMKKDSREVYQRCAKTLLQVGNKHDDVFKQDTGMRLEIIPLQNPYETKANSLIFKVLFDSKPIKNSLVLVWQKGIGKTKMTKYRSNAKGEISFPFQKNGIWMVSTVRMVECPDKNEADWQSYWGSYTFGFL